MAEDRIVRNKLRAKLLGTRAVSFGTWIASPSLVGVDALRHSGLEWMMIDGEHAQINPETVAAMVALLADSPATPLIRVGNVDPCLVKQALDSGAHGVLAPLVNSAALAEATVSFAKYPPRGLRGAAGSAASRYGRDLADYLRRANEETLVGVQIETRQALDQLDAIADVEGVDLLFVGPQDLALSLGLVDQRAHPTVRAAMRRVVEACDRRGKIPGTLVANLEEKRAAIELGFRFVSLASDLRFLLDGAQRFLDG